MATIEHRPAYSTSYDGFECGVYKILGCWADTCRVRVERGPNQTYRVVHTDGSERSCDIDIAACPTLDEKAEAFAHAVRTVFADVHPERHEPIGEGG